MASIDPVLVVGGCGSLGHHIVNKLFEAGASDVTVFDLNITHNIIPKAKYVQGSIQNSQDVLQVLKSTRPRTIIHTASPAMLGQRNTRQIFYNVNVNGTKILLESIAQFGVTKALVYTSSSSVVHNNLTDLILATEDLPYCGASEQTVYYTQTKAEAEKMILASNRHHGLFTAVIRGCTLFDENDHVIPTQISSAKAGRGRIQISDGKNLYDWTYVGNAAQAHTMTSHMLYGGYTSLIITQRHIKIRRCNSKVRIELLRYSYAMYLSVFFLLVCAPFFYG